MGLIRRDSKAQSSFESVALAVTVIVIALAGINAVLQAQYPDQPATDIGQALPSGGQANTSDGQANPDSESAAESEGLFAGECGMLDSVLKRSPEALNEKRPSDGATQPTDSPMERVRFSGALNPFSLENIKARTQQISEMTAKKTEIKNPAEKTAKKGFSNLPADSVMRSEDTRITYSGFKEIPAKIVFEKGLEISNAQNKSLRQKAIQTLNELKPVTGIEPADLTETDSTQVGGMEFIKFQQYKNGIPVYLGLTSLVLSNGKLLALNSNYFGNINTDTSPTITVAQAIQKSQAQFCIPEPPSTPPELVIYPKIMPAQTTVYLAYRIDLPVKKYSDNAMLAPTVFIDAKTGNILDVFDRIREIEPNNQTATNRPPQPNPTKPQTICRARLTENISGRTSGSIVPDHLAQQRQTKMFSNEYINYQFTQSTSDQWTGEYRFNISGTGAVQSSLEGPWVKLANQAQPTALGTAPIVAGCQADISWKNQDHSYQQEESNVFYHANRVHDFFSRGAGQEPFNVSGLDFQMIANVEIPGTCNAYADGTTINFFAPGGGCEALSLSSDVIYHEYTHNLVAQVAPNLSANYWGHTGNMNEGYADYYACSLNNESCMGNNFLPMAGECLRNCENTKKFPQDYTPEPHSGAEIISGAVWDIRQEIGQETTDTLALLAVDMDPQTFQELADNFIIVDDAINGNSDLTDGSPNGETICSSFYANHGIYSDYCFDALPLVAKIEPIEITGRYFDIIGSAGGADFNFYTLEYTKNPHELWQQIASGSSPIDGNVLFENFDLLPLDDGEYQFRLVVGGTSGESVETEESVSIKKFSFVNLNNDLLNPKEKIRIKILNDYNLAVTNFSVSYSFNGGAWSNQGVSVDLETLSGEIAENTFTETGNLNIEAELGIATNQLTTIFLTGFVDASLKQGWPQTVDHDAIFFVTPFTRPSIFDLDKDGHKEIVAHSRNYAFFPEFIFKQSLFGFNENGQPISSQWPVQLNSSPSSSYFPFLPVSYDIDNDNTEEILQLNYNNQAHKVSAIEKDGQMTDQFIAIESIPDNLVFGERASISLSDLNNDGEKEIIVTEDTLVNIYNKNGEPVRPQIVLQPNADFAVSTYFWVPHPAIGDLDNDGQQEIVKVEPDYSTTDYVKSFIFVLNSDGTLREGWPKTIMHEWLQFTFTSPVLGDLDNDGNREIVIVGTDHKLHVFNNDGSYAEGWPQEINSWEVVSPVLADMDNDGTPEIIVTTDAYPSTDMYIFRLDGTLFNHWTINLDGYSWAGGELAVGDITGDGYPEIIGTTKYFVYAYDRTGALVWSRQFPTDEMQIAYITLDDIDNDDKTELIAGSSMGKIYVWDFDVPFNQPATEWPMFMHDPQHTGCYDCTEVAPPQPVCGNGLCESGENGLTCPADCQALQKRVFVTSQTWNGNLSGLTGVDSKCRLGATIAGLDGRFKAWISDSNENASSGLAHSTFPYIRTDGNIIANNWQDLTDGNLLAPINLNEFGQENTGSSGVWTGTKYNGNKRLNFCNNWTSDSSSQTGDIGASQFIDSRWTELDSKNCDTQNRLYCIEQ